ncbi:MAG: FHA domain-containing protein [Betaproteobacteria bacterium]|nr:FHA domain-containing protein [Betaproteobacteria bacterium]
MGKLLVSLDGVVIQEVQITKDTTTLGRRPYNDIVIDNLTVSGEHALLHKVGQTVYIEDLNSTNGTYINGKAIRKQQLSPLDAVEIGRYKINYWLDTAGPASEQARPEADMADPDGRPSSLTSIFSPPAVPGEPDKAGGASIKVLSGAAAGRAVVLTKVVTTVGKPGVLVASITKRPDGYVLAHVEGAQRPCINGVPLQGETTPLSHGDLIELDGTQVQFLRS